MLWSDLKYPFVFCSRGFVLICIHGIYTQCRMISRAQLNRNYFLYVSLIRPVLLLDLYALQAYIHLHIYGIS